MATVRLWTSNFALSAFSCSAAAQRLGNFVWKVLKLFYVVDFKI